jgi:hypothetical protein
MKSSLYNDHNDIPPYDMARGVANITTRTIAPPMDHIVAIIMTRMMAFYVTHIVAYIMNRMITNKWLM